MVVYLAPGYERKGAEELWLQDEGEVDVLDYDVYPKEGGRECPEEAVR